MGETVALTETDRLSHVGGFFFPPWTLLFPALAAGILWVLGNVCIRHRWARIPLLLLPVVVGALIGIDALAAPHGYAAGYSFGAAWVLAVLTALAGALLLIARPARKAGLLGLAAAAMLLASFYLVFLTGYRLGIYAWRHEQRIEIPATPPH